MPKVGTEDQAWAVALSALQKTLDGVQGAIDQFRQQVQVGFNTLQMGVNALSLQVGQINGRVRHVEDRTGDHSQTLADLTGQVAAHMAKIAELDAILQMQERWRQADRLDAQVDQKELKEGQSKLWSRLWEVSKMVFRVTEGLAVMAAVLKFAGVW